jgi:hypothetical protein
VTAVLYGQANPSLKASVTEATAAGLPSYTTSSMPAALTATANGALTVDGVSVAQGDRVLVKNETSGNAPYNGIYVVTAAGSSGTPWMLTRSPDMSDGGQVPGAVVFVEEGTANTGSGFMVASAGPFTLGTTNITWTAVGGGGIAIPVTIADGGTGQTTQQAALDAIAGATTAARVLAGNGTHVTLRALAAGDLPAATTSAQGAVELDGTAADITEGGTQAAGSVGKAADSGHVHPFPGGMWLPADWGLLGANADPGNASGGGLVTAGTLYLSLITLRKTTTITKLWYNATALGSSTSTGSFAGLLNSSGTLLSGSSDIASSINASGTAGNFFSVTLTSQQSNLAAGTYYAVFLSNLNTTQPTMLRMLNTLSSSGIGAVSGPANYRFSQKSSFGTSLGAVTLSGVATTSVSLWVGWS